jgi:ABC-type amino acid transport substrate-binding protein
MSGDPAFASKVNFSALPLFPLHAAYFYNLARPLAATSEGELSAGAVIGTVFGYEYPASTRVLRGRGVIFEESQSEQANLKKLANGRIDAAIVNLDEFKTADYVIKRAGVEGRVAVGFSTPSFNAYIGFSVTHPDGEWARQKFNSGYAALARSAAVDRLRARWGLRGK